MAAALALLALALGLAPLPGAPGLLPAPAAGDGVEMAAGPLAADVDEGVAVGVDAPLPVALDVRPCGGCPAVTLDVAPGAGSAVLRDEAPAPAARPARPLAGVDPPAAVAAASSAAALLAFGAWLLGRLGLLGAAPVARLFSRIEDGDVAGHPTRRLALAYIEANPGASLQDVRRAAGVAWGTAVHHLRRLRKAGLVAVRPRGGAVGHWAVGAAPKAGALPPTGQALAALVRQRPGLAQAELARLAGLGAPAACKQLRRLEEAGLVAARRSGRARLYDPAPGLDAVLALAVPQAA